MQSKRKRGPLDGSRLEPHTEGPVQERAAEADIASTKATIYTDKFGRKLSAAVLQNWSPCALEALEVRPLEAGGRDHDQAYR